MAAALKKQKKITVCGLPILFQKKEIDNTCIHDVRWQSGDGEVIWSGMVQERDRPAKAVFESGSEAQSTVFLL